jgi:alkylhydroperoxidase family enzyme
MLMSLIVAGALGLVDEPIGGQSGVFSMVLDDAACWSKLPPVAKGGGGSVPNWVKALVSHSPNTAAALLELDLAHRTAGPLEAGLRAKLRLAIASANRCEYSRAVARFDAERAGVSDLVIEAIGRGEFGALEEKDRLALGFVRGMTLGSWRVTDEEFAGVVRLHGERCAAAMVLLSAYGNFQDRLLLCLGVPIEAGGPMAAVDVVFAADGLGTKMAAPPLVDRSSLPKPAGVDAIDGDGDWASTSYEAWQARLEGQRGRSTRLRVPSWDEVERGLPAGFKKPKSRIVWDLICCGYVPELAAPWETVMRTNGGEMGAKVERTFALSVFWVITRAIECPYCMGHCEMNWEVAGLTPEQIAERSRLLAGDDWSSFPEGQQRAFAFARKLTKAPWEIVAGDVAGLCRDMGEERGLLVLLYACRCNYMTRISNGFQLSLERENVFWDYYGVKPPGGSGGAGAGEGTKNR